MERRSGLEFGQPRPVDGTDTGGERKGYSRPPTAQEAVLREIREAIMARRIMPGQWVRQWDVARQLDVSSVPVREALNTLAAEGQVIHERHRGYKVVELSSEQLEEIYLARRLLETETTRRAIPKVDAELVRRLEDLVVRMVDLAAIDDILGYAEANRDFHLLLFERAGLPRICRMIEVLWQNSEAYRSLIADPAWYQQAHEDHRALLEACKARDVEGAVAAQDAHRQHALNSIIAFLKGSGD
jgi:DNA-binding GntR family transcriptional regulator